MNGPIKISDRAQAILLTEIKAASIVIDRHGLMEEFKREKYKLEHPGEPQTIKLSDHQMPSIK